MAKKNKMATHGDFLRRKPFVTSAKKHKNGENSPLPSIMVGKRTVWIRPFLLFYGNSGEFLHKMVKKDTDGKFLSKKKVTFWSKNHHKVTKFGKMVNMVTKFSAVQLNELFTPYFTFSGYKNGKEIPYFSKKLESCIHF